MFTDNHCRIVAAIQFVVVLTLLLLMASQHVTAAVNKEAVNAKGVQIEDPGSDLWRNVRQRQFAQTTSQVKSGESNIFINISGESWRQYRMAQLIPKAGVAVILGIIGVLIFRLLRGKIKLQDGRSGIRILRFTLNQRVAHWSTAILFVVLALTGLILMFGRKLIIPVFGNEAFGNIAIVAKTMHDYLGPAFGVALIILFILFVRENLPSLRQDINWLMKGGGLFGAHVSSDRYNAGEKGWFWIAAIVGGTIVVSGMVLDFPIFEQTRETMEYYHVIHSIAAIIMIIASFGHIYMGTAAMEGTFEVMQTGYCDANWAKEHHDLWYEKVKHSGQSTDLQAQPGDSKEAAT